MITKLDLIQGENKMPLMRGHSSHIVSSNIKELINSGRKPKQAIAISLANARKYKKMAEGGDVKSAPDKGPAIDPDKAKQMQEGATESGWQPETWKKNLGFSDGGQVVSDGGMGDIPREEYGKGGDDEPLWKMDEKGPEDYQRNIVQMSKEANYYPEEVANPNEQDEEAGFAAALRRQSMQMPSPENYAMGGLVQDGPEGDEPVGNKPSEDMEDDVEDPGMQRVGKPYMKEPSGMGLSMEAMEALKMKKKMRRYAS